MAGIEKLKKQVSLIDGLAKVLEEAKADDGKITWSDLLDKDVWEAALGLVDVAEHFAEDFGALKEELKDLEASELLQLCVCYMDSIQKLYDCFADKEKEEE